MLVLVMSGAPIASVLGESAQDSKIPTLVKKFNELRAGKSTSRGRCFFHPVFFSPYCAEELSVK